MRPALPLALLLVLSAHAQTPPDRVADLKARAGAKVKQIGELAASGKLTQDEKTVELLQELVDELKAIRRELERIAPERPPIVAARAERITLGGYVQFQYQNSDRNNDLNYDPFRLRRIRPSIEFRATPQWSGRLSFDLATDVTQAEVQLRDAWINYSPSSRITFRAGQQPVPLGYELERSSADREFPERATYNRLLFPTERSRGVLALGQEGRLTYRLGTLTSVTFNDPEATRTQAGDRGRLAAAAQVRYGGVQGDVGLSGFFGERPAFTRDGQTSPALDRRFVYLDGRLRATPRLTLRGELMQGFDRIPSTNAAPTRVGHDLAGYQLQASYDLSRLDQLSFRWEGFDPDLDRNGDALNGYGVVYRRLLNPLTQISLSHEVFVDGSRASLDQERWQQTILRLQIRF